MMAGGDDDESSSSSSMYSDSSHSSITSSSSSSLSDIALADDISELPFGLPKRVSITQHFHDSEATALVANLEGGDGAAGASRAGCDQTDSSAIGANDVDKSGGDQDQLATLLSQMMSSRPLFASNVAQSLAERANVIESIRWLGCHVPKCAQEVCVEGAKASTHSASIGEERRRRRRGKYQAIGEVSGLSTSTGDHEVKSLPSDFSPQRAFASSSELSDARGTQTNETFMSEGDLDLPIFKRHKSVLLFVDISGFTTLSRILDVESLSKVINSYFQSIIDEIHAYGGDVLKFAGDALFAEWTLPNSETKETVGGRQTSGNICKDFYSCCVMMAAECGARIVSKCADQPVDILSAKSTTLNVHCGLSVGDTAGLHVGDDNIRREFLLIGDPVDCVGAAANEAEDGQLAASPEFVKMLVDSDFCEVDDIVKKTAFVDRKAAIIATRAISYFRRTAEMRELAQKSNIIRQCPEEYEGMDTNTLIKVRHLFSLYIHDAVEEDTAVAIRTGKAREIHAAEAELREVFTMFIGPTNVETKLTGDAAQDSELFYRLHKILILVIDCLERYGGHLRQYIIDDKGLVLVCNFGLRGSTFPNMITERALPAAKFLHEALQMELSVDSCIGATYGNAYCGVVGAMERHEYAVLGSSVNLAARLMSIPNNPGIVVDDSVRLRCGREYSFNALEAVKAKGYDQIVPIFEPISTKERSWGKARNFAGRQVELKRLLAIGHGQAFAEASSRNSDFVWIESLPGVGKSTLLVQYLAVLRKSLNLRRKSSVITRHVCVEGDSLVPFSMFRSTFLDILVELDHLDSASASTGDSIHQGRSGASISGLSLSSTLSRCSLNVTSAVEKLSFVAKELNAPPEFTTIVSRHLLGLEINDTDSVNSKGNKKSDSGALVKFMARAFVRCTSHTDLVVLVLDDVHLMDNLSWKVVETIFELSDNVLIICASRPIDEFGGEIHKKIKRQLRNKYAELNRFHSLELRAMNEEDIRTLISLTLGCKEDSIDPFFSRDIYTQCGGMPAFACELLSSVQKLGLISEKAGKITARRNVGKLAMFSNLADLLLQRIDSLDAAVRRVLHVAAVLGSSFNLHEVIIVSQRLQISKDASKEFNSKVRSALNEAVTEGILEEVYGGGSVEYEDNDSISDPCSIIDKSMVSQRETISYNFRSELWRSSILKLLLGSRKSNIHRTIAEIMEAKLGDEKDYRSLIRMFRHWKACGDTSKFSSLSLTISEIFVELGLFPQAEDLLDEGINMWNTGGGNELLTSDALNNISAEELEDIFKLHVAKGKVLANMVKGKECAAAYNKALDILHSSAASKDLTDRSFTFPAFSGLFIALKFGNIAEDDDCTYEKNLVKKFVQQTYLHGDPIHYTRALAMQGEMYARLGEWEHAFEAHQKIMARYDADLHSKGICKAYGSDRTAQSFGQSARWHMQLGNPSAALQTCHYVINDLMPKMEMRNCHNSWCLLWPTIWVMKDMGFADEAAAYFDKYIIQMFHKHYGEGATTPARPCYTPTMILLDLYGKQEQEIERLDEYIAWAEDENNYKFSSGLNSACAGLGRDLDSLAAEILLLLSKRPEVDGQKRKDLISKGLSMAEKSADATKPLGGANKGKINSYQQVMPVLEELKTWASN